MKRFYGFYIESSFLNGEARNLTANQLGILIKLFEVLNQNPVKTKWGFLVDEKGKPLTERKIRYFLGSGSILPHRTWTNCKEAFIDCGAIKPMSIKGVEYLYSPAFIRMNPYQGLRKRQEAIRKEEEKKPVERFSKDYFLGYDPADKRPDSELDDWGRVCRRWIELTWDDEIKIPRSPFPLDWDIEGKRMAKTQLLMQVEQIGIEQALHDMAIAFDYKIMRGGDIQTLTFFIARWMADDWRQRNKSSAPPEPQKSPADKAREKLYEETKLLLKKGTVKTRKELHEYFPRADSGMLDEIAEGLGIE